MRRLSELTLTPHLKRWLLIAPPCFLLASIIMVGFHFSWWDLSWQKSLIQEGQYWRLWSGHWQHLTWNHWLMNQFGLMLILWLMPMLLEGGRWLMAIIAASFMIGMALLWTDLQGYVGLSGLLYGLLFYGCLIDDSIPRKVKVLLLSVVAIKVVVEQVWPEVNATTSESIGGLVAIDAHLFGSLAGLIMAIAEKTYHKYQSTDDPSVDSDSDPQDSLT